MPLTQLETEMRAIARARIVAGELPRQAALRMLPVPALVTFVPYATKRSTRMKPNMKMSIR